MASSNMAPVRRFGGGETIALRSPINRASLAYWDRQRGPRTMPRRQDIDPAGMVPFLPHVFLLDVRREPLDFRYRLIGTVMDQHMNEPYTGRWMSGIEHQKPPSVIWRSCELTVETRRPCSSETPYVGKHKDFKHTEDIIMPLSDDGGTVNMLLVTAAFI